MPATFVRLFLVRHAEALANPELRYLGSRDDPLTERGKWQALQLAHAFAPLDLAAVYTSPHTGRDDGKADRGRHGMAIRLGHGSSRPQWGPGSAPRRDSRAQR